MENREKELAELKQKELGYKKRIMEVEMQKEKDVLKY
jgi:hypothetical protein